MNKYYKQLNIKSQEIAKEAIKNNSILSESLLEKKEREFLLNDWNAFLVGLISDQSVKMEMAWRLPYRLYKRLGHFDLNRLVREESVDSLAEIIREKPSLHRYPKKMAEYIFYAAIKIVEEYDSNAENIWKNDLNVENIINKLEQFKGISHKKAALGTLLLVRDFNVNLNNKNLIDITYDVHIRRVFLRMGLVERDNIKEVTSIAREICKDFPGSLTLPFWVVGREFCRPSNPNCEECYFSEFCQKKVELGKKL